MMIPSGVCDPYSLQQVLTAAVIVVLAILLGLTSARFVPRLGCPAVSVLLILVSIALPLSLVEDVWPFDPHNDPHCGYTPDPNLLVFAATFLVPVLAILSLLAALLPWKRRAP
jgi:hypothetical protein